MDPTMLALLHITHREHDIMNEQKLNFPTQFHGKQSWKMERVFHIVWLSVHLPICHEQ